MGLTSLGKRRRKCGGRSPWRTQLKLIYPHYHATGLDDGVSCLTFFKLEFVRRLVGDRSGDNLPDDINPNMGSDCALLHLRDFAFKLIARAQFHETSFRSLGTLALG